MPFFFGLTPNAPSFQSGELAEWPAADAPAQTRSEIAQKFKKGTSRLFESETPRKLVLQRRRKQLPDLFFSSAGVHIVSAQLASLLQKMEPEVHQLLPIDVTWRNGETAMDRARLLILTQRQNRLVPDVSDVTLGAGEPDQPTAKYIRNAFPEKMTLRSATAEKTHLWREEFCQDCIVVSDELHNKISEFGLNLPKLRRVNLQ